MKRVFTVEADGALARNSDPDTSHYAACSIDATALEAMVLEALKLKPMTSVQLAEVTGLSLVSISPRLRPLVNKGRVVDSGERGINPSGRRAIIWKLK